MPVQRTALSASLDREIHGTSAKPSANGPGFRQIQLDALRFSYRPDLREPDSIRLPRIKMPCMACR